MNGFFFQILKLCGTRGKRKREDIQIVDVNQQEVCFALCRIRFCHHDTTLNLHRKPYSYIHMPSGRSSAIDKTS